MYIIDCIYKLYIYKAFIWQFNRTGLWRLQEINIKDEYKPRSAFNNDLEHVLITVMFSKDLELAVYFMMPHFGHTFSSLL